MEKIKASEVLKGYKYYARDTDGTNTIFKSLPIFVGEDWELENGKSGYVISVTHDISISEAKGSIREIDFSEDFTEERLALIDRITSYLAKELSLRDYNRIKGFFEDMEKPDYVRGFIKSGNIVASEAMPQGTAVWIRESDGKLTPSFPPEKDESQDPKVYSFSGNADELRAYFKSLDLEKEVPEKEPTSIFKIDDTVHVLSYSNVEDFGKSTEGIIKTIYKDGTILVKVDEGVEEVYKEDNVSFTPFSIKEAGFSQVRPVQEPKEGDWGFFYDAKNPYWFTYSELGAIKKNTSNDTLYFAECGGCYLRFSHTPPQLAADIPNPFTKC